MISSRPFAALLSGLFLGSLHTEGSAASSSSSVLLLAASGLSSAAATAAEEAAAAKILEDLQDQTYASGAKTKPKRRKKRRKAKKKRKHRSSTGLAEMTQDASTDTSAEEERRAEEKEAALAKASTDNEGKKKSSAETPRESLVYAWCKVGMTYDTRAVRYASRDFKSGIGSGYQCQPNCNPNILPKLSAALEPVHEALDKMLPKSSFNCKPQERAMVHIWPSDSANVEKGWGLSGACSVCHDPVTQFEKEACEDPHFDKGLEYDYDASEDQFGRFKIFPAGTDIASQVAPLKTHLDDEKLRQVLGEVLNAKRWTRSNPKVRCSTKESMVYHFRLAFRL